MFEMYHSKSCRCDLCNSIPFSSKPQECSRNWKNRFCKLRKQWSPCEQAVGKFGVAWVAELPNCETQEPKGWQVEIIDSPEGIIRKCKQLMKWLNNPPSHLYDSIEGNDMNCNSFELQCHLNICEECCEEPCCGPDFSEKYGEAVDNCSRKPRIRACANNCSNECSDYNKCKICFDEDHLRKYERNQNNDSCLKKCNVQYPKKSCFAHCTSPEELSGNESDSRPNSRHECKRQSSKPKDNGETFRKENCCCHCQNKFYKDEGTSYEVDIVDIVPQRDIHNEFPLDMHELDSKVICAGIRTSQICKKVKEDRRNQLIDKHERELQNTIIASRTSGPSADGEEHMNNNRGHNNLLDNNLNNNSSRQRRSSKFRRKESF
ncbi:hypothetical protein HHI36_020457 [Cryptolaemus montrouzieri]|uniref:Uncharacterized protein n=1 Tax=Cryptolaemus montrouzieri TaxID=559131 RepID=A0ABD2NAS0_9CUCU